MAVPWTPLPPGIPCGIEQHINRIVQDHLLALPLPFGSMVVALTLKWCAPMVRQPFLCRALLPMVHVILHPQRQINTFILWDQFHIAVIIIICTLFANRPEDRNVIDWAD